MSKAKASGLDAHSLKLRIDQYSKRPAYDPGPKPDGAPRGFMNRTPAIKLPIEVDRYCLCRNCHTSWIETELVFIHCICTKVYDRCTSCPSGV